MILLNPIELTTDADVPGYRPVEGPNEILSGDDLLIYKTTSYDMPDNPLNYYMDSWDLFFDKDSAVDTATPIVFLADSQLETLPVRNITEKF
jgi:hypothetical protein